MASLFLITYDITSPKRLQRLHRALKACAMPVQYSVFLGRFGPAGLAAVEQTILAIINPRHDDVRIYPLPARGWSRQLGRSILPAGISFSLLPDVFRSHAEAMSAEANEQHTLVSTPLAEPTSAPARKLTKEARRLAGRTRTGQHAGIWVIR